MKMGLIRNHYVGRTFIEPQQSIRHFGVKVKLNPVRSILEGQRVVLVDDSIVRGTTSRKIVKMVRAAGAREVHLRISCPPTISPCFYGVDTPNRSELIAATHTIEEIRKYVAADTPRLSEPRRPAARGRTAAAVVLHLVLHRRLSGRLPARSSTPTCSSRSRPSTDADAGDHRGAGAHRRGCGFGADQAPAPATPRLQLPRRRHAASRLPTRKMPSPRRSSPPPSTSSAPSSSAARMAAARTIRRADPSQAVPALLEGRRVASGRLRPLPRPRAALGLQRSAHSRRDARRRSTVAERSPAHRRLRLLRAQPRPGHRARRLLAEARPRTSEFVRPALTRALAAYGTDPKVQATLTGLVLKGQDFFRSAVIEALGDYKAAYAVGADHRGREARRAAPGRCGPRDRQDRRQARAADARRRCSASAPRESQPAVAAAICLLGVNCESHQTYLADTLTFAIANDRLPGSAARASAPALASLAAVRARGRRRGADSTPGAPARDPARAANRAGASAPSRCATRR